MKPTPRTDAVLKRISVGATQMEFANKDDYEDFCFNELKKFAGELENENASNVSMLGDEIQLAESLIQERDALALTLEELHAKDSVRTTEHNILTQENRALTLRLSELEASLDRCANAWNTNQDVPYWVWQSIRQMADKALAKQSPA